MIYLCLVQICLGQPLFSKKNEDSQKTLLRRLSELELVLTKIEYWQAHVDLTLYDPMLKVSKMKKIKQDCLIVHYTEIA